MLVEAGAGSGKTSIMAGRVALMISSGEDPGGIVAITFTEAAASELRLRIEEFLRDLADGRAPRDLAPLFQGGVGMDIIAGAQRGLARLDGLTATTIHGFAQALLRPYPLEAGMDPGATIADPEVAAMAFDEAIDGWMRDRLNDEAPSFLADLFAAAPTQAAAIVRDVAQAMRRTRGLLAAEAVWREEPIERVRRALQVFIAAYPETAQIPEDLKRRTVGFRKVLAASAGVPADKVAWCLTWALAEELIAKSTGDFNAKACTKKEWVALGRSFGWSKIDIAARIQAMERAWDEIRSAWDDLKTHAAAVAARRLTEEVSEALAWYATWKPSSRQRPRAALSGTSPWSIFLCDRRHRALTAALK
jgi:exodeoxyribonuclease-5